jgi:hypothetical protein
MPVRQKTLALLIVLLRPCCLATTDANGNGSQGNMWTLMSKKDVIIL